MCVCVYIYIYIYTQYIFTALQSKLSHNIYTYIYRQSHTSQTDIVDDIFLNGFAAY